MTPMVDLGFLLITFFVFTSSVNSSTVDNLIIPADGTPGKVPQSATLSVLLGKDDVVYTYEGILETAIQNNTVIKTNYHVYKGLGSIIRQKQQQLQQAHLTKDTLMLLIKPTDESTYENLVNVLDEVKINNIKRYFIMPAVKKELDKVLQHQAP